jgi:hypothetical protein
MIPGWPYSFVAALESGPTSWTAILDAIRLPPGADVAATTAAQLREVVMRLIATGQWAQGDPQILIVADAGYDAPRIAFLLADLPVQILGRLRSDRVFRRPAPLYTHPSKGGRPAKHGSEFALCFVWPPNAPNGEARRIPRITILVNRVGRLQIVQNRQHRPPVDHDRVPVRFDASFLLVANLDEVSHCSLRSFLRTPGTMVYAVKR